MKLPYKLLSVAFSIAVVFAACKEENPGIIFDEPSVNFTDTTYIGQGETAQDKGVLVEDYTGVRCSNCPKGHEVIEVLRTKYPGRVSSLGIHAKGEFSNFTTPFTGEEDFRIENVGTQILNVVGRPSGLPYGTIDRVYKSSTSGNWESLVLDRMSQTSKVNLYVEREYNDASRELKVKVKAVFTDSLGTTPFFSVGIVESGMISPQKDEAVANDPVKKGVEPNYVHNHVLRAMPAFNENLLPTTISLPEKNRVVEKAFTVTLDAGWNAEKSDIVFFVHRNAEILNVKEISVK